eukprot:TRINITY_DN16317_c1_g1_i2.p1 TRINITY_DN16317_c1_g1~~TRINITY_DN16317_c1_g1_i2.p1  ORF type:complete len:182 (+),score=4.71 TRINITY_DN16317_c1_g1_i2:148-693(+)
MQENELGVVQRSLTDKNKQKKQTSKHNSLYKRRRDQENSKSNVLLQQSLGNTHQTLENKVRPPNRMSTHSTLSRNQFQQRNQHEACYTKKSVIKQKDSSNQENFETNGRNGYKLKHKCMEGGQITPNQLYQAKVKMFELESNQQFSQIDNSLGNIQFWTQVRNVLYKISSNAPTPFSSPLI